MESSALVRGSAAFALLMLGASCSSTPSEQDTSLGGADASTDAAKRPDARADSGGGKVPTGDDTNGGGDQDADADGPDAAAPDTDATPGDADGDADTDAGPDATTGGDATPGGDASDPSRGMQNITVDQHPVWFYLPQSMTKADRGPVVFSLHGLDVPALAMADATGLPALAEQEHLIAIFPEGASGIAGDSWNTGNATCGIGSFAGSSNDDDKYLNDILDAVEKVQAINRSRVFMSGFSMGAYGTHDLACEHRELARAGAASSGGRTTAVCGAQPVPMIIFHGKQDGTISYDCGVQARTAWAAHNGCSTDVDSVAVTGGTCETSKGCPVGGEVVFCTFDTMGHGWPGSTDPFAFGGGTANASATTLMWNFFKKYL